MGYSKSGYIVILNDMTQLTLDHFTGVISMSRVYDVMIDYLGRRSGKAKYKRLLKWLSGQTVSIDGVFESDLERFLRYDNKGKEAPILD